MLGAPLLRGWGSCARGWPPSGTPLRGTPPWLCGPAGHLRGLSSHHGSWLIPKDPEPNAEGRYGPESHGLWFVGLEDGARHLPGGIAVSGPQPPHPLPTLPCTHIRLNGDLAEKKDAEHIRHSCASWWVVG